MESGRNPCFKSVVKVQSLTINHNEKFTKPPQLAIGTHENLIELLWTVTSRLLWKTLGVLGIYLLFIYCWMLLQPSSSSLPPSCETTSWRRSRSWSNSVLSCGYWRHLKASSLPLQKIFRCCRLRYIARMYITFLSPHTCFGSVCCSIQTTCCTCHSSASHII